MRRYGRENGFGRAGLLAADPAGCVAAGAGTGAAGRPARRGGPRGGGRRAAHRRRLSALPGGHQRQRRVRERAGTAAGDAGHAAVRADLRAARRGRPRRLHRPERRAAGARQARQLLPGQRPERQPGRRVLQPGPGDRAGGAAAAAGIDQHGGAHARRREGVRDRRRRQGQLPVPAGGRAAAAGRQAVHPVLPGGGDRGGPARPGRRVRPGGGEHLPAGGDPAVAAGVLLRVDRVAPGPGHGRDRCAAEAPGHPGRGPAAAGQAGAASQRAPSLVHGQPHRRHP